ncbi:hypothetical protein [Alkalicoccus urumqiensis]|uniref:Uncharacterized protein n=1 Tax=Alkalicoccus urumqiensis TaxID=1548213 RepID=A0A2P6MDD8_ALKUR|nr:hypothetical protein [Alkalicoccus urumqiensis]PRO64280.1 hypothetical protein C6I21_15525 [Alkalicoccus urumqiensis]
MKTWKKITASLAALGVLGACGGSGLDTESYDPGSYTASLPSSEGGETEIFTDDRADLYYYFTGVT